MDEAAIEELRRADTTWHRPTWKLGGRGTWSRPMGDAFGVFGDSPDSASGVRRSRPASEEDKALAQLGLSAPVRLDEIKARYKQLVKQLHPDVNGAAADDVERLKRINQAYSTLKALHA